MDAVSEGNNVTVRQMERSFETKMEMEREATMKKGQKQSQECTEESFSKHGAPHYNKWVFSFITVFGPSLTCVCVCVCFRARCVFHPCPCAECMYFSGLHQQFTSHYADLSASSWASTSTNSYPAWLTNYFGGVSRNIHMHTSGLHNTPDRALNWNLHRQKCVLHEWASISVPVVFMAFTYSSKKLKTLCCDWAQLKTTE